MNNIKIKALATWAAFALMSLGSCKKDFLDTKPSTQFAESDVWSDPNLIQLNLNSIYNQNPFSFYLTSLSVDEARSYDGGNDFNMSNMLLTPDNAGWGDWNGKYRAIRDCNIFLENIDKLPDDPTLIDGVTLKNRLKGEAIFLRAWYYQMLVSYFGGVPLITKSYILTDDFSAPRNTYEECIKFISDECDMAASLLPLINTGDNNGRATKGAALALKSRVLLYAASKLHEPNTFAGFAKPELLGYTGGDNVQRWQAAKSAAKAVIDLGVYSLYQPNPESAEQATKNYEDLFTSKESTEDIFVRYFNVAANLGADFWPVFPNGFGGIEYNGATSETVDAFEMSDGTVFSRNNPDQNKEPYKNRDPRFYATILYEGAKFRPRPSNLLGVDPVGVLQVGTWEKWDAATGKITYIYGLDSRNSAVYGGGYNNTGTSMLKFINRKTDMYVNHQDDLTWRYIRYTEVILNYAEACIELGENGEARTYLNMIRKRAGMPGFTESGSALKMKYQNERRIEMLFENQRFFDVRRWMIGPEAYHPMHGVDVVYKLNADKTTATIPTITPVQITTGKWEDKAYFMPISRSEMNKNNKLVQNPGYN
ncbi:RagB/SusD family nutrient uptake outer membrane protein [Mucilaginibacter limnophilus]|uniref:RagB/SusD family nutrient uptake outer membrane protein n=1 Tax=Mucilaginibacter limnophilus TaxID=1932778 RepID=A0A437MIA4_9SPHI|nr:RagB/SusD family nutrient uptake outer membrane protein [Mucilaginibacter limnophilus]RVT97345.1 RagB/SusD family nutrient uptake outer membrane protein [Mucilaginibacter limnophilus]